MNGRPERTETNGPPERSVASAVGRPIAERPARSPARVALSVAIAVCILCAGLLAVRDLAGEVDVGATELRPPLLLQFVAAVLLTQLLAAVLWHRFSRHLASHRSLRDAVLDTGLMALGKYAPGKVWGLVLRGRRSRTLTGIDRSRLLLSLVEQGYSLGAGISIAIGLYLAVRLPTSPPLAAASLVLLPLAFAALTALSGRLSFGPMRRPPPFARVGVAAHIELALGYGLLWLSATVPFLLLLQGRTGLPAAELVEIAAAFVVSVIAGWLALFAPAGIGVRETAFALLSPAGLSWQESAYWIALHRVLLTATDVGIGTLSLLGIGAEGRRPCARGGETG